MIAADAVSESILRTRSSAASPALSKVPERLAAMWIEKMRSYPSSSS